MSELAESVVEQQTVTEHQPVEQQTVTEHQTAEQGAPAQQPPAASAEDAYAELEDVDFLDDIDFSLEDVESRIAPLALAHR
jgi:hypothetical protein